MLREHTQHQVRTDVRPRARSDLRAATPSTRSSPAWTAFHAMSEPVTALHRRPARVPRPQRHAGGSGGASRRRRARRAPPARASIRAPRCSARSSWSRARPARSRSCSAPRQTRRRRAQAARPSTATSSAAASAHRRSTGRGWARAALGHHGADAGADVRRDDQPLDALPGAGLPDVGAARRSTRAAAPTASATSCRT